MPWLHRAQRPRVLHARPATTPLPFLPFLPFPPPGLLSIALANEDYAGQSSSTPLVPAVARYLRRAMLDQQQQQPKPQEGQKDQQGGQQQQGQQQDQQAGEAAPQSRLCHGVPQLRRLRLCYCCALLGCVGEYLDALGPVLAERGADSLLEMMRRYAGVRGGRSEVEGTGRRSCRVYPVTGAGIRAVRERHCASTTVPSVSAVRWCQRSAFL